VDKQTVRETIKRTRAGLDPAALAERSAVIQASVMSLPEFAAAKALACYLAMPGEVRTDAILDAAWSAGKTVCVPAWRAESGMYGLSKMARGARVRRGAGGAPEPVNLDWMDLAGLPVIVTPGLAFDAEGGRIGHGGGHYDRLLRDPAGSQAVKIGLALEAQMFTRVPTNEADVRMNMVVTEERVIRINV